MVDLHPSDHVRLEVAFESMPDDTTQLWTDITSRLDLSAGISRTYGAQDEFSQPQPATCTVSVDNKDGALTAGNTTSPFYPNVRPQRRMRLSYRDPSVAGNLLSAENASFEGGTVGGWTATGGTSLANSATHPSAGSKGLLVTWATAASGDAYANVAASGFVTGRTYTLSARVWVPAGHPPVAAFDSQSFFRNYGTASATTGALTTVSRTFVAGSSSIFVGIATAGASTAGQQVWVDSVMVDEGPTVGTFTTADLPITYLFTGHVEEWPTEWPGGQLYSQTTITATDRLARIGSRRAMRSVIEEAVLADGPRASYPLGEAEGSVLGGDVAGQGASPLSIATAGSGAGTLTFGTATGPPTDGLPAPQFTPSSAVNGKYLTATIPLVGIGFPMGVAAAFLTSSATGQVIAQVRDDYGSTCGLTIENATGKLVATMFVPWFASSSFTITSATSVADGGTHYGEVLVNGATATLWLDGTLVGTAALSGYPSFKYLDVGGSRSGSLFTGTISHVAVFGSAQALAKHSARNTSVTTGFAGERSDQRIARYAAWAGVQISARTNLVANPSFEANTTGWSGAGGATLSRTVGTAYVGIASLKITCSGGASQQAFTNVAVTAGQVYAFSGWAVASAAVTLSVFITWKDAGAATISGSSGSGVVLNGGTFSLVSLVATAPALAVTASVSFVAAGSPAAGVGIYLDAVMAEQAAAVGDFIDDMKYTNLDVGSSTSIAFTDTTGLSILQAMQDVAQTEGGRLFINGAGDLVFHARSRKYANPAAAASISARMLSGGERFTLSTQGLVNDLTGQRPDGPQIRAFDQASIGEFGTFNSSMTLLVTTDNEVADAVNWRVSTSSQPEVRLPQGTFDLYTDATTGDALRSLELGDRLAITSLPSQAPASSMDFVLEGYSESISVAGWSRTANLTNYSDVQGLTLDDNVYGLLDGDNRLVY